VCDGDAEEHEAYGSSYENSKLMDYKAGHDAGYAAVYSQKTVSGAWRVSVYVMILHNPQYA